MVLITIITSLGSLSSKLVNIFKTLRWFVEIAESITCLLHKHKNLRLDLKYLINARLGSTHLNTSAGGEAEAIGSLRHIGKAVVMN